MAARPQQAGVRVVALRRLAPGALELLLKEEAARWRALLRWDFSASAELVRRYADMQALDGFALLDGEETAGYTYWVGEERKGLIGDLYVRDGWRSDVNENLLLAAVLDEIRRAPWIHRVEAQLLQLSGRGSQVVPGGSRPRQFARYFMLTPLEASANARPLEMAGLARLERWAGRWMEPAAELICRAYDGHVDSEINDQYHSAAGARRFLQNIVQYPGCGQFSGGSSWVALDARDTVVGLALASRVSPESGHITQLCVMPDLHGSGLGFELLRRSLRCLGEEGAVEASLTVTAENRRAIRLYERFGFRAVYHFEALVWDRLG